MVMTMVVVDLRNTLDSTFMAMMRMRNEIMQQQQSVCA